MTVIIVVASMAECEASVLGEASKVIHDPSVLRRLLFATSLLPEDTPKLWEVIAKFVCSSISPKQAQMISENISFIDSQALTSDATLFKELVFMPFADREHLGVILMSSKKCCVSCNGKLLVRADRPSYITLYTESYGTIPAFHYRKYCANGRRGCNMVQHYGYHTKGSSKLHFDLDWHKLQYFISSQETAFELQILCRLDFEILIGQLSYKQRAEIYNAVHGYESLKKRCSGASKDQDAGTDDSSTDSDDNL